MIVSAVLTFLVYGALVLQRYNGLDPAVAASTETMLRSSATAMLVFVGALVPIAMGRPVTVMFAAFVVAGLTSELVSETVRIHMYRRGV